MTKELPTRMAYQISDVSPPVVKALLMGRRRDGATPAPGPVAPVPAIGKALLLKERVYELLREALELNCVEAFARQAADADVARLQGTLAWPSRA